MAATEGKSFGDFADHQFFDALFAIILFAASILGYLHIANSFFERTKAYSRTVLGVDHFAVTRHMCDLKFSPKQHRTTAHPLFALYFRPICGPMKTKMLMTTAAMRINLVAAALGNILFYFCLRKIGLKSILSALFTAFLALSISHLIYGTIAETYIFVFTSLTLLLFVYLYLSRFPLFFIACLAGSLVSTGITATNAVFGILLYFFKIREKWGFSKALLHTIVFSLAMIIGLFALIKLQHKMYPNLKDFFAETTVSSNTQFLRTDVFDFPGAALAHRLPHLFVFNEIAPGMVRHKPGFPGWPNIPAITLISITLYFAVISLSVAAYVKAKTYRLKVFRPLSAYFLFNVCFFLFYGSEPHLYYEHYTFAWIAMLALPFASVNAIPKKIMLPLFVCIVLLLPLVALNNWYFIQSVLSSR